jgi:hypothetical protein
VIDVARTINYFALAAGVTSLVVLVVSLFEPWWQLTIGHNFFNVYSSPINTNFGISGSQFTIPLIWAWNLSNILLFLAGGIIMLTYAFLPTKTYSMDLLSFSWKKPLYALISFVVGLVVIVVAASFFDVNFPLMGTGVINFSFPSFIPINASINTTVTGAFLLPFWLAIAASVLCVAARIYHGKLNPKPKKETTNTTTPENAQPPPPPAPMIS